MTLRTKIELLGGVLFLGLMFLVGLEELRKHDANLQAAAKVEADKDASAKIDSSLKARDAQYTEQISALEAKYKALSSMSTQQVAARAQQYLSLPQPIVIKGPNTESVVDGTALIPQVDIKPIATAILDGEQCKLDRAKCQADLTDWQGKEKLQEDQTAQWKTAAKGGSVWERAKHDALIIGITGGFAYIAGRAHK
jgi:hypothetical protein